MRVACAPVSGSRSACNDVNFTSAARGRGILYGGQILWLAGEPPSVDLAETPEYMILIIAAVAASLFLLWNFILRKRLAKYRNFSSVQGERYRQFFENCPDALLVVEHDGSIVTANEHAFRLFKVDSQELLAKTFWNFVPGVSRSALGKQFRQCVSGSKMRCEGEVQATDGTVIAVEVIGSLQNIGGNNLVQLYIRDMRVLREVEDQVRSLYNRLDDAHALVERTETLATKEARLARKDFIAFANHRIRTPLDGIMGMAQLLADTPLNIEQHNCVHAILTSSASLLNAISSMGDVPAGAIEEAELQAEWVDLRAVCETLSGKYEPLAVLKGIDLRCDCQSSVPQHVVADEQLLGQVLSALLDNAIKYTEQGLVMLNIECRRQSNEGAELYFQVIDTGIGIDRNRQSLVFEQVDRGMESQFTHGLGLVASRKVIEKMGGTIDLISTAGKGSTFYFCLTLPLTLPKSAGDEATPMQSFGTAEAGDVEAALVLVVDDNKISQKVVVSMLRMAGCDVDAVGNGQEALLQIKKKQYDVVLMDCQMPVMDGFEATSAIRCMDEPYRSIPVLALTAHSLKHELQACRSCGMDGYLVKPVDRKLLIETVSTYAQKRRQARDSVFKVAS